jgi:alpha-N-arabinofuranosidase
VSNPHETRIIIHEAGVRSAVATTLANSDMHAHNTFEQPHAVTPGKPETLRVEGSLTCRFQPVSVTKLEIELV